MAGGSQCEVRRRLWRHRWGRACPLWAPGQRPHPVTASLSLLRAAELSEPPQNTINGMWDLMADQLRVPMNLATLRRWYVGSCGDTCSCVSVGVPAQIFIYGSLCFSLCLDVYDMWGAVKFLVPEFGLTALLPTSELYRLP